MSPGADAWPFLELTKWLVPPIPLSMRELQATQLVGPPPFNQYVGHKAFGAPQIIHFFLLPMWWGGVFSRFGSSQ